jgi:murein DD-endopeptidase MepM/ murein hydrolase activator NlpD
MRRPRTIFGPLAVTGALLIGFALGRVEPSRAPPLTHADFTKGSKVSTFPPRRHERRVRGQAIAGLIVPVRGVPRDHLSDTWGQARSQGRHHEGIDILAPQGTPVLAAADGRIVRFFDSVRGGVTIYQFDRSERFVYYYAHLYARAPLLREGDVVRQGQLIGYVGATGNAPVPHLHFEIQRLTPERRWWRATSIDPYPYLLARQAPS